MGPQASAGSAQSRKNRTGELSPPPIRSPRLYHSGAQWFFKTREGVDVGPYFSEKESEEALADFVSFAQDLNPEVVEQYLGYLRSKIKLSVKRGEFPCRKGEKKPAPERKPRTFEVAEQWFFKTREGTNIGPYASNEQADSAAKRFVKYANRLKGGQVRTLISSTLKEIDRATGRQIDRLPRSIDDQPLAQRSRRVFEERGHWYIKLRGGKQLGPYASEIEAASSSKRFTVLAQQITSDRLNQLIKSALKPEPKKKTRESRPC